MRLLSYLFILFTIYSCKQVAYQQNSIPSEHIEFGYLNSKTGASNAFILADNGQLFQKDIVQNRFLAGRRINQKDADFIYSTVGQLKSGNSGLYQISEETLFVRIRKNNTLVQEWKWKKGSEELPREIQKLDLLLTHILEDRLGN
ncbi:MAG: hypothetical protein LCH37_01015 [Bacteroidetes bacterium]|nr:hypothetical protein [Bacteroidota bacterium]